MPDIQIVYPQAGPETLTVTMTVASLASSTTRLAGRQSAFVDNRTTRDIDHMVSGKIRMGTSPTAGRALELWAVSPWGISSAGGRNWPDVFGDSDAAVTVTSDNIKHGTLRLVWSGLVDATSDRDYTIPPTSLRDAFGNLPPFWALFLTHDTGVALNATAGAHFLGYQRIRYGTP